MRNIKKFAKDFNLEHSGDNKHMTLSCNGLDFEIKKGAKGYGISCKFQKGDFGVVTQKHALWSITETLRWKNYIDESTLKEMRKNINRIGMHTVKANVGKTKKS
ncbi:hypothetical protein [Staphylococcus equorum]|uniref:hypothetical protein n=1 Tax=Staphylococcus equorum TaxID=246432 RepID=UPI000852FBD2|nr:hypothetical protein [Staphylococcus equorum]OEK70609.1 hypothetical protein AST02_03920 [Staphylococcus equorum]